MSQTFEAPQADEKTIGYNAKQSISEWIVQNFDNFYLMKFMGNKDDYGIEKSFILQ